MLVRNHAHKIIPCPAHLRFYYTLLATVPVLLKNDLFISKPTYSGR